MLFLSIDFAQDPIHPEPIVRFDQNWLVWLGTEAPPEWPNQSTPEVRNGLYKIPANQRSYSDRLISYSTSELTQQQTWLTNLYAPYSLRSQDVYKSYLPERTKQIEKRKKYKKRPFSRTEFVQPNSQPLHQLYLLKSFEIEDPSVWTLQGEAKFSTWNADFLNGTEHSMIFLKRDIMH